MAFGEAGIVVGALRVVLMAVVVLVGGVAHGQIAYTRISGDQYIRSSRFQNVRTVGVTVSADDSKCESISDKAFVRWQSDLQRTAEDELRRILPDVRLITLQETSSGGVDNGRGPEGATRKGSHLYVFVEVTKAIGDAPDDKYAASHIRTTFSVANGKPQDSNKLDSHGLPDMEQTKCTQTIGVHLSKLDEAIKAGVVKTIGTLGEGFADSRR